MARRPPDLGGEPVSAIADGSHGSGKKECLPNRDDFGLETLLRGLVPESSEIRRDDHPSHNFHSRVLESGDLRPEIVHQRLKTSGIHQLIVGFLESWWKTDLGITPSVPVAVIRKKSTHHSICLDGIPEGEKRRNYVLETPEKMVGPHETLVRVTVSTEKVGLPRGDSRYAGGLVRFGLIGNRVGCLRGTRSH